MMIPINNFNPNDIGLKANNIFGLPFSETDSQVILLPVPWEVTVSYRKGTARVAEHIFRASLQVDLFDPDAPGVWQKGYYMLPVDESILIASDNLREEAELILEFLGEGGVMLDNGAMHQKLALVNDGGQMLHDWVYKTTLDYLRQGKKVGLIGGDHSTPLGYIKALGTMHSDFGILQIDAHADLRIAYEGFTYSHASIMYNVMKEVPQVTRLVQVGIRDYCDEEADIINDSNERIITFYEQYIREQQYAGATWQNICQEIISKLPQKVYISFDIDGLDPKLCPDTGTPVPGGFEIAEIYYLFKLLHQSGREIIGFDLNEVSNGDYEGDSINVMTGARLLYKLCNYLAM